MVCKLLMLRCRVFFIVRGGVDCCCCKMILVVCMFVGCRVIYFLFSIIRGDFWVSNVLKFLAVNNWVLFLFFIISCKL